MAPNHVAQKEVADVLLAALFAAAQPRHARLQIDLAIRPVVRIQLNPLRVKDGNIWCRKQVAYG